jgi:hypothetical protein
MLGEEMTRDDIIRMAREVGLCDEEGRDSDSIVITGYLERFANLVAAAEREACAQIAHNTYEGFGVDAQGVDFVKQRIAFAIRERGAP